MNHCSLLVRSRGAIELDGSETLTNHTQMIQFPCVFILPAVRRRPAPNLRGLLCGSNDVKQGKCLTELPASACSSTACSWYFFCLCSNCDGGTKP